MPNPIEVVAHLAQQAGQAALVRGRSTRGLGSIRRGRGLAQLILLLSLPVCFGFLIAARPPIPYYALPLAPIALAAVLYEFVGGTLVALVAIAGVGVLTALDPDASRRAVMLREAWPILSMYLAAGPFVGWLAGRERERERALVSSARRLHVVQEIAQAINTSLDLEETLHTVAAEMRRLVPFEQSAAMLVEGDSLVVVAADGGRRPAAERIGQRVAVTGTAAGWAVRHRRPWSGGPAEVARMPDTRLLFPAPAACLILPLEFQRKAIGAFALGGRGLDALSEADLDDLTRIAGQIAMAVEHARLFEVERRRARNLAAIGAACREIAASLDLDRTLRLVMAKAVETLPMDAGALFQHDASAQAYRVMVSHNVAPDQVAEITFALDEGVPGWVMEHRQALNIPDAAADGRVHPRIVAEGVRSVLALPLVARRAVVGVLGLYSKTRANAFDDEAVRLAQVFADQAAVFIENARLVDELRRAAAELEARVEQRTRQLAETQAQILRSEKLAVVGRLAASVAHEVNNPLQAIALQFQHLADEALSEPARRGVKIAQEELGRIASIVQRLLDLQRPTVGERAPHRVSELLDDVLALTDRQLQRHGVTVIREEPAGLAAVLVTADQVKQVLLNLILNAVEAMPNGGELRVETYATDGMVAVAFTDNGIGMAPETMAHLFEPFCSTKPNGTGLGLAVSHEIAARHGGRLEARSVPGRGSTFTVTLPAQGGASTQSAVPVTEG